MARQKHPNGKCDGSCQKRVLWVDKKTHEPFHYCMTHSEDISKCQECGDWFHTYRQKTKTCSDRCRKAKSRKQSKQVVVAPTPSRTIVFNRHGMVSEQYEMFNDGN